MAANRITQSFIDILYQTSPQVQDFGPNDQTKDVAPVGWTERWAATSSEWTVREDTSGHFLQDQYLEFASTVTDDRFLSWDGADGAPGGADVEVMARVRFESTVLSVAGDHSGIRLRGSGSGGSENAYNLLFNDNHTLKITKFVSGTQTQLDSDTTLALLPERWYLMRFRVNGTSLEGSIWIETEKEPVSPQVTATDSAITAAGWVGFGGDGHFVDNDIDWVSISFAGAVSSPPAIPAQARVSTNFLEVLSAGAAEARVSTSFLEAVVTDPAEARVSASFLEVVIAPVVASATTQVLQILKVPPSTLKVSQQIIQALVIQDPAPNVTMQVLQILHGTNVQPPSQSSSANISVDVNT